MSFRCVLKVCTQGQCLPRVAPVFLVHTQKYSSGRWVLAGGALSRWNQEAEKVDCSCPPLCAPRPPSSVTNTGGQHPCWRLSQIHWHFGVELKSCLEREICFSTLRAWRPFLLWPAHPSPGHHTHTRTRTHMHAQEVCQQLFGAHLPLFCQ